MNDDLTEAEAEELFSTGVLRKDLSALGERQEESARRDDREKRTLRIAICANVIAISAIAITIIF